MIQPKPFSEKSAAPPSDVIVASFVYSEPPNVHSSLFVRTTVAVDDTSSYGVVPTAENEIAFDLGGAGRIIGLDNGRPDSHESYQGRNRKAFGGLALALLQSATPGILNLRASSPGLKPALAAGPSSNTSPMSAPL